MITYDLNTEDVANLIKSHLCDDLDITNEDGYTIIRSDKDEFFGMIRAYNAGDIVLEESEHNKITMGASAFNYTSLFIGVTPEGVFQFNLSLLRLDFETYVDHGAGIDVNVASLDVSNGVQILEWYPEFSSEDEYIDALMSNGDDVKVWEDGDNW